MAIININVATLEQLEALNGVGRVLAERVLRYRQQHGGFRSIWELVEIEGFSAKTVQSLSKLITARPVPGNKVPVPSPTPAPPPPEVWPVGVIAAVTGQGSAAGYRVSVRYERAVRSASLTTSSVVTNVGVTWRADLSSAVFDSQGRATLNLPPRAQVRGELVFEVSAPDGRRVALTEPTRFDAPTVTPPVTLRFGVAQQIPLQPLEDPTRAIRRRIKGQVIDLGGRKIVDRQVTLFGESAGSGGAESDARALAVVRTDGQGNFSLDWPETIFSEAYGHVAIGPGFRVPIHLEASGQLPLRIILAVDLSSLPDEEDESCCAPGGIVPRAPDASDLADTGGVYSQDLGGGRCVDFTKPERVLEEYSYQFVVRTTDPEVKPLRIGDTPDLPAPSTPEENRIALYGSVLRYSGIKLGLSGFAPRKALERVEISDASPVDWDLEPTAYQACSVAHGHILSFKQQWVADGYSLGTLLYSLPLAPGQKKQIAIVDWERRETASRTETLTEADELQATLTRDRDINDIVNANLNERGQGSSSAFNIGMGGGHGSSAGAGGAANYSGMGAAGGAGAVDSFAGAFGFASSDASQSFSRDLSSNALQTLRDRTAQGASSLRNRRSTVVQTVTQGERTVAQSESVANYNHCHAITMQYFEVLRHLLVRQELVQVQECLFVPLQITLFDARKALQWREPLARSLRDRSLSGGFNALDRVLNEWEDSGVPVGRYADQEIVHISGTLRLRFQLVSPAMAATTDSTTAAAYDASSWNWYNDDWARFWGIRAQDMFNRLQERAEPFDKAFHQEVAPKLAQVIADELQLRAGAVSVATPPGLAPLPPVGGHELPLDLTLLSEYRHDVPLEVRVRLRAPVTSLRRRDVTNIVIDPVPKSRLPANSRILVEGGNLQYRTAFSSGYLFRDGGIRDDLTETDGVYIDTPLSHDEQRDLREEDRQLARRLLDHLNDNLEYYHKAIWTTMSPDRRYMMLDGFLAPNGGGRSLASVVDNRVIGVVGNSLVMPVARGMRLDPVFRDAEDEGVSLLDHYRPTTPDDPLRIALPTKGIYAEAVMGQCNSCEIKEEDRFWRWEESPIPDSPTPIQPVSTDSRRSEPPSLTPQPFSSPIINLQNAPAAPDPTGMANALQLLSNPNLFRDITGLEGNQRNALEAMKSSLEAAQQYGAEAADVAKSFGQYATNMAMQQSTGGNIERINRAIGSARESGLITDDQASELTHSALSAMVGRSVTDGGSGDTGTARDRLDTIRGAVDDGTIDESVGGDLAERALERLVNDGESSDETPARTVEGLIDDVEPGSSIEARDGDREVIVRGGGQVDGGPSGTTFTGGTIQRVWMWPGGRVYDDATMDELASIGITDFVVTVNSLNGAAGEPYRVTSLESYFSPADDWAVLTDICTRLRDRDIEPHVMMFLLPDQAMIRSWAPKIEAIRAACTPRSILFDIEEWWDLVTARVRGSTEDPELVTTAAKRLARAAIAEIVGSTVGQRPAIGYGITHLAAGARASLMSMVDFGVPQMYSSESNYGTDLARTGLTLARRHYQRTQEALGAGKPVYVGQTLNPDYAGSDASRAAQMLDIVLQLGDSDATSVSEIAFWSTSFIPSSGRRREFLRGVCRLARGSGLNRTNLADLLASL